MPFSCLCFRPPQSRRSPRKSAQKRPEILLRGRDAAPPRRRSHSGSQRRTWGFIGLCCQLSLHPPAFRFGNLPLVALLHDFIHGNYGVAQAAVFPDAVSHLYLRSLRNNEPALLQQTHILGHGIAGEMQAFCHGHLAGIALICPTVGVPQQVDVHRHRTGRQVEAQQFVWHGKATLRPLPTNRRLCFSHRSSPPFVPRLTHSMNFPFGTTMRLPTRSAKKLASCINS